MIWQILDGDSSTYIRADPLLAASTLKNGQTWHLKPIVTPSGAAHEVLAAAGRAVAADAGGVLVCMT